MSITQERLMVDAKAKLRELFAGVIEPRGCAGQLARACLTAGEESALVRGFKVLRSSLGMYS